MDLKNSQWIVYDLGGGTFDVALVKIVEGELKVVDHEGDNYLGGADFDALLVERIIVSVASEKGQVCRSVGTDEKRVGKTQQPLVWPPQKGRGSKNRTIGKDRRRTLSFRSRTTEATALTRFITVTQAPEYEATIKDSIDATADMLKKILTRNALRSEDLKFILMVGGSTYTPFVRKRVEELVGIPVNTGIDPTNAIAIGAAYFAAGKEISVDEKSAEQTRFQSGALKVRAAYNRTSMERGRNVYREGRWRCHGNVLPHHARRRRLRQWLEKACVANSRGPAAPRVMLTDSFLRSRFMTARTTEFRLTSIPFSSRLRKANTASPANLCQRI